MQIAIDATPLLGQRTGVGAFTLGALTALATRSDVEIRGYALTWRGRGDLPALLPAGVAAVGGLLPARPLRALWLRADWPRIDRALGAVDVVHGSNFVVPPTRAAAVVTVHDLTSVRFPELCTSDTRAYPALLRRAIARGAWVHTVSQFVADEVVAELGADAERVVVVPEGVPPVPSRQVEAGSTPESDLPGWDGDRYVLALGTVEPRKDLGVLVRAFDALAARHPELRLVIAGPDGWGAASLQTAIDASPHRDRVTRAGYVSDRRRADLLRGAAVLAYASRYEGFGLPPLEAMAAGVPVVATAAGALPEVLGDSAALVAVGDADGLAAALERVLDDDAYRATLVAAGRRRVRRYSWERCAEGLVQLYRRAAA